MSADRPSDSRRKVLVVLPNWVGDVVMATPALAALRGGLPDAHITYMLRPHLSDVVAGGGWHDDELYWSPKRGAARERDNLHIAGQIRATRYDAAILLTNSFRSAALAWLARIPLRIGFARDGRGWMLTERLRPLRRDGRFLPVPAIEMYAQIVERAGCPVSDLRPRLVITPEQQQAADALKAHYGLDGDRPYAVIAPGAAFGAAKCWLPERFGQLCDSLADRFGLRCVQVGAPGEAELLGEIARHARSGPVCMLDPGTSLGSLKGIIGGAALLVCNDSGPRHYGIALNVPTVTIFGPTDQEWTRSGASCEIRLQAPVACGPCQLRRCPIDHRCMKEITVLQVADAAAQILGGADGRIRPTTLTVS